MEKTNLKNTDIDVFDPNIDFWLEKLVNNQSFSWSKLNHSFWEMLVGQSYNTKVFQDIHGNEFIDECVGMLSNIPADGSYFQGVSCYGPINVSIGPLDKMTYSIKKYFQGKDLYLGVMWKKYCLNGDVKKFIKSIQDRHVVFVGLPHIKDVPSTWGLRNYDIISTGIYDATTKRYEILEKLIQKKNSIIIFQLGEMLSFWFINKLHKLKKGNCLIDMGRSLDIFSKLEEVEEQSLKLLPDIKQEFWSDGVEKYKSYNKIIIPFKNKYLQNILAKLINESTGYEIKNYDTNDIGVIIKLEKGESIKNHSPLSCYALTCDCWDYYPIPKFVHKIDIYSTIKL